MTLLLVGGRCVGIAGALRLAYSIGCELAARLTYACRPKIMSPD